MANCGEMKKGEIYTCKDCGLELEVVKQCEDENCGSSECGISCCGTELVKK